MAEAKDNEKKVLKGFKKMTKKLLDKNDIENWLGTVTGPLSAFSKAVAGFDNEEKEISKKGTNMGAIQETLARLGDAAFEGLEEKYTSLNSVQAPGIANDKGDSSIIARETKLLKEHFKKLVATNVVKELEEQEKEHYKDNNKDLKNGLIGECGEFDELYSAVKKLYKLSKGLGSKATLANGKDTFTEMYSQLLADLDKLKNIKFYKNAEEYKNATGAASGETEGEKKK